MIRPTSTNVRQLCTLPYLPRPRLFRRDAHHTPGGRFVRLSFYWQRREHKSTSFTSESYVDSVSKRCQRIIDNDSELFRRIIDRAFEPNPPITDVMFSECDLKHRGLYRMVTPDLPPNNETHYDRCQRIINEIFGVKSKAIENKVVIIDPVNTVVPVKVPLTETLQATTAKEDTEKLAQKVEQIDETPLVEAHKPSIEGFNITPKVLGGKAKGTFNREILTVNFTSDKNIGNPPLGSSEGDMPSFDELAKRCLESPSGHIDERLLKEMEKLGVPPPSDRGGSKKPFDDNEFIQADVMKELRKPMEKTEFEFASMKKKEFERIQHGNLPPPFELTSSKFSNVNVSGNEYIEDTTLKSEVKSKPSIDETTNEPIPYPYDIYLKAASGSYKYIPSNEELAAQHLVGQMASTVMSGEETREPSKETIHLKHNEELKNTHLTEHISVTIEETIPRDKYTARDAINVKHLEHILSAEGISPENEVAKENMKSDVIQNLLQTRTEHLTRRDVKPLYLFEDNSHMIMKKKCDLLIQDSTINKGSTMSDDPQLQDPVIICKETTHLETDAYSGECTKVNMTTDNLKLYSDHCHLRNEAQLRTIGHFSQLGIMSEYKTDDESGHFLNTDYKPERLTPDRLFTYLGIITEEDTFQEPGVVIRELSDTTTPADKAIFTNENSTKHANLKPVEDTPFQQPGVIIREHSDTTTPAIKATFTNEKSMNHANLSPLEKYGYVTEQINTNSNTLNYTKEYPIDVPDNKSKNLNKKPSDKDYDEPVIVMETGRLQRSEPKSQGHYSGHSLRAMTVEEEPDTNNSIISSSNFIKPLLDKGTVAHYPKESLGTESIGAESVGTETIARELPTVDFTKPQIDETLMLSQLLKRVRERNRLEYCRQFVHMQSEPQVEPIMGGCGSKTPPCPPPARKCPPCPPPKPTSPPPDPPCPDPCKPKCNPPCEPRRPKCPPENKNPCDNIEKKNPCDNIKQKNPCDNIKKNPCDKFKKCSMRIRELLTLMMYLGPQLHIPQYSMLPMAASMVNMINSDAISSKSEMLVQEVVAKLQKMCCLVLLASTRGQVEALQSAVTKMYNVGFARTYDPWSPIPSWPIPEKLVRNKLQCPKDGCKPPRLSAPCRDVNPCIALPKPNSLPKRSFSIINYFSTSMR